MKSLIKSFIYAGRGIWFCVRRERNFRIHIISTIYVLWFGWSFTLSRVEWAVLLLTLSMVMAAEAVNTAIEHSVDLSSPDINTTARIAKDAAAAAVLICSAFSIIVGVLLFYKPAKLALFWSAFVNQPWKIVLLAVSLIISFIFIKYGGIDKTKSDSMKKLRK
jgi:diacylglycerol kinase (ATP)